MFREIVFFQCQMPVKNVPILTTKERSNDKRDLYASVKKASWQLSSTSQISSLLISVYNEKYKKVHKCSDRAN